MKFQTQDGLPVLAVSSRQMREVDRIAVNEAGPPLAQMMENAGCNLAGFICEQWPRGVRAGTIVVLAGPGHNGGGGICAAYHLLSQGVDVRLCLFTPSDRLADATTVQLERYLENAGMLTEPGNIKALEPFLIVDAMIGYGLRDTPSGIVCGLISWANGSVAPVVALDVPSGLDADTGRSPGACIMARQTLTLALPKPGLKASCADELWLADIGIRREAYERLGLEVGDLFARGGPDSAESGAFPFPCHGRNATWLTRIFPVDNTWLERDVRIFSNDTLSFAASGLPGRARSKPLASNHSYGYAFSSKGFVWRTCAAPQKGRMAVWTHKVRPKGEGHGCPESYIRNLMKNAG